MSRLLLPKINTLPYTFLIKASELKFKKKHTEILPLAKYNSLITNKASSEISISEKKF